jgi:hypothetical protein
MFTRIHVKCPFFLSDFNETWIFLTDFRKYSNIKFRGNSSSGRRGVLRWRTYGRIDMTKLTVAFSNFSNAPETCSSIMTVSYCVRILQDINVPSWSQWPRNLSFGSAAARLLGLRIRIPLGEWMSVSCVCCLLSGRGLCVGLTTIPEDFYRLWCVWVLSWSLDENECLAH